MHFSEDLLELRVLLVSGEKVKFLTIIMTITFLDYTVNLAASLCCPFIKLVLEVFLVYDGFWHIINIYSKMLEHFPFVLKPMWIFLEHSCSNLVFLGFLWCFDDLGFLGFFAHAIILFSHFYDLSYFVFHQGFLFLIHRSI